MQSVLHQSYSDFELLVIDDNSSEDLKAISDSFGDARVRYFKRDQNGGAAAARNTGYEHAVGEFIAFQDSDDLWLPGKLERQVAMLEEQNSNVGCVTGPKILYGRDNNYNYGVGKVAYAPSAGRWITLEEDQLKRSLLENRISLQNALFRRVNLPDAPLFDASMRANEDWNFTIRLTQGTRILEDHEPVVFSYITPGSVSQDGRRNLMGTIRILRNNESAYTRYPKEHALMLYKIGNLLIGSGRPRAGLRIIVKSIKIDPSLALRFMLKMGRDVGKRALRVVLKK